jgi:hypothetical protein
VSGLRALRPDGVIAAALSLLLAACGTDTPPGATGPGTAAASPDAAPVWLAAVEVAPRADDLDPATDRLREVFGGALVVSPTDCFAGLPGEAGEGYLIGAVADTRQDAERLLDEAGEGPLFVAPVMILCSD